MDGVIGENTENAAKVVVQEAKQRYDHALILSHLMVELNVLDHRLTPESATSKLVLVCVMVSKFELIIGLYNLIAI